MNAIADPRRDALLAAAAGPIEGFDVSNPALYEHAAWGPYFARMRAEAPVHWCADSRFGPYWSLSCYKDILATDSNHGLFSSEIGGIQVVDQPVALARPSFIRMDPPKHDELRRVVQPIVAPQNLVNMEKLIRERTCAVLDRLPRNVPFDWVELVSIELTTLMLATLFDFPYEDRAKLTYWSDVAICDVADPEAPVASEEARFEVLHGMATHMSALFDERRKQPPRFDLLSMLAHGAATRDMPLREFMGNLSLLIVGGNDTTRNSMTAGLLAMADNPGELAKLRADPSLIPGAVSEIVRWATPVLHMRRTAVRDVEMHGKTIRAGDKVVMWYVSGNRDDLVIEQPERFWIDRPRVRQHLAFGFGVHRCVGNRLAELQLQILWEELLPRFSAIEVLGPPRRLHSNFINGIRSVMVRLPG